MKMKYYWKWVIAICFMFVMAILNLEVGCAVNNNYRLFNMFCSGLCTAGMLIAYIGFVLNKKNIVKG